jgi:sporulation integral membrane protein YtvI
MLLEKIEAWYEKKGKRYIQIGVFGIVLYIFFKYILRLIAPFIVAWVFAILLNPIVSFLKRRFAIPRGVGTLLAMLTVLSGLLSLIGLIFHQLWQQIVAFAKAFPLYQKEIEAFLEMIDDRILEISEVLPIPEAFASLDSALSEVLDSLGSLLGSFVTGAYDVVSKLPGGILFFVTMLIAIFFITKDYAEIKRFAAAQIPEHLKEKMTILQGGLSSALGGYVRTQLILMCFTFVISFVGLFVLRREYALLIALGIGFVDALPVFGSGAVLIPWGVYMLIMGDYGVGVGLLSVYVLIVVMRQIMEPKVLSTQIGVYALVTLMSIYIGIQTLGPFGIIIGPVIVVSIQTLQRVGLLPEFKRPKPSPKIINRVKIKNKEQAKKKE